MIKRTIFAAKNHVYKTYKAMKKIKLMTLAMCLLSVVSCSTKQGTGAAIGAGGGAVLGGIIGNIIGKNSKSTAIGAAIGSAVGAGTGAVIGKHMDKVAAEAAAQVQNAQVEQVTDANGLQSVKITFPSGILFSTNKADLSASSKTELAKFSSVLKNNADCYVDVWGHTDSTGNDGINIPLSENRAQSVVNYLESCGVSASQFKNILGKGSSTPVADNTSAAGRKQNRRVEVYLYASQEMVNKANAGTLN
jgi:outer membrane protein OmpA-like peptidoglycan-associated protein